MANNRLYIGNMETLEFACISKDAENGTWRQINETGLSDLNAILSTDSIWRAKTALVFFTEADSSLYDFFTIKKKQTMQKESTFTLTEAELAEACKVYNTEFITNPEEFGEIKLDDETCYAQARHLIAILMKIKNNDYATNEQ